MNVSDLLTPWLMLIAVLVPLIYVEKWIHSHLYGVGWLLTDDEKSATILYYILLFPGVLIHELVQWLVAGMMRVRTKRVRVWPEPQDDGTLRLDFVQLETPNRISAAIIGAVPLIVGLVIIWTISNYVLNLDNLLDAIGTSDLPTIANAIGDLASTPDFYLWLYLLFAISNAMLPTSVEREGWPLILALAVGVIVFLVVIGTGEQLLETYQDTVIVGVERLTTAFATVLAVEIPAMVMIGFGEEVLERTTQRKFQYAPPEESKPREPGSAEPLPPGEPKPSVYLLDLPVPLPPDRPKPQHAAAKPEQQTARPSPPQRQPTRAPEPDDKTRVASSPTADRTRRPDRSPDRDQQATRHPSSRSRPRPESPRHRTQPEQQPGRSIPPPDRTRIAGSRASQPTHPPTEDRSRSGDPPAAPARGTRTDPSQRDQQFRRPETDRPLGPRRAPMPDSQATDDADRARPQPRRSDAPERTSRPQRTSRSSPRTPSRQPQPDRSRPGIERDRPQRSPLTQPPSPPYADQNAPDEDEELEYIPFDDVEIPPDDEL